MTVLLAPDPKLVMKDSFGSEHLDAVVGPVGDQEVAFARTTNSPRSTKFSVFLSFDAEREEGSRCCCSCDLGSNVINPLCEYLSS